MHVHFYQTTEKKPALLPEIHDKIWYKSQSNGENRRLLPSERLLLAATSHLQLPEVKLMLHNNRRRLEKSPAEMEAPLSHFAD